MRDGTPGMGRMFDQPKPKTKIRFTGPQTQAIVSLLHTVDATGSSIDLTYDGSGNLGEPIYVTVWRDGDPTTWQINLDGYTKEV